eukprot:scaffold184797_cov22-Cyclotella_meneghiniana.AAC.1
MIEVANPEAASSLFADEESSRRRDDPAVTNRGLESNNEPAELPDVNSSPEPRGSSVTFSVEDEKEAEPPDNAHYRENIGFSKQ